MSSRQKFIAAACMLAGLLLARSATAGPPFITDDPEPVDYQHWEVYFFTLYNHDAGADFAQLPGIEVNYGVIPDVQLHIIPNGAIERQPGQSVHYGLGDTELGVKWRFLQESDTLPMAGIFPLVELPTGDSGRGLGNGETQIFLPLWLQKSWGKDKEWTCFGGGGFWINPGRDHRDFFRLGIELQRDLSKQLTLGGEIYHETPAAKFGSGADSGMVVGSQGHTAFNLGGYYNFDDNHHLLFSAGRDLDGPDHFSLYFAYQLTF